jgi:hypothetical protein
VLKQVCRVRRLVLQYLSDGGYQRWFAKVLLSGWASDLVEAFLGVKQVFLFQGDTDTIQDAINKGARILGADRNEVARKRRSS